MLTLVSFLHWPIEIASIFIIILEYCENYKAYMANIPTKGKSAAPIQVPLAGGQFYGNTESKEQFIIHAIPTRVSVWID